jgi:hypothetical protein
MRKRGGGLMDFLNAGLWGEAYAQSDGSLFSILKLRLWYGFLILSPFLLLIGLYFAFAKPVKKEPFHQKDKRKSPMFRSL